MIAGWLKTVAVTGFVTGAVRKILPTVRSERIIGAVKLVSALIMIIAVLLPLFNLVSGYGESINKLFSPIEQATKSESVDKRGLFIRDTAKETVESAIKALVSGDIGREDFDVYIAFSQNSDGITVNSVTLAYPRKSDFPSVYVKEMLEEKLETEVELIEKDK